MVPQCSRSEPFYPLELTIEVRIIAKASTKADVQNTQIRFDQQLRCSSDTKFIQICSHGAPSCPLEKSAQGRLIHMKAVRDAIEFDLFFEVFIQVQANCIDPLLIGDTANGLDLQGGQDLRIAFSREIGQHGQQDGESLCWRQRWKPGYILGNFSTRLGVGECEAVGRMTQQATDGVHFFELKEMLPKEIVAKLQDNCAMSGLWAAISWA